MKDIIPAISIESAGFIATPTGLARPPRRPEYPAWEAYVMGLDVLDGAVPLAIGDALRYGKEWYGEAWSQVSSHIPPERWNRWRQYMWVAERVPYEARIPGLGYTHYRAVAALEPEDRDAMLELAAEGEWTTRQLNKAIKDLNGDIAPSDDATGTGLSSDEYVVELEMRCPLCGGEFRVEVDMSELEEAGD